MDTHVEQSQSDFNGIEEILTIGHSALPIGRFVDLLDRHGIDLLVDIRRHPGSRHAPQFGGDTLRQALAAAGIAYASSRAWRTPPRPAGFTE